MIVSDLGTRGVSNLNSNLELNLRRKWLFFGSVDQFLDQLREEKVEGDANRKIAPSTEPTKGTSWNKFK